MLPPPPLSTRTDATVDLAPTFDRDGSLIAVVIIKQDFLIDRFNRVERMEGAEIRRVDVPWDEEKPDESSTKLPADTAPFKPGTDVIVVGSAASRESSLQTVLDVLVGVGPVERILRVFGTRVWYRGLTGLTLTSPEPFESVPLQWEYAFGGFDSSNPKKLLEEPRNPVGRGLAADPADLVHKPGPQIEDPTDLITTHRSRPVPAGVGAIGRHWEPRRRFAGTYDDAWKRERVPLPPLDFDDRFNQCAPPEMIATPHLRGGELVRLHNVSSLGPMQFQLPRLAFYVGGRLPDGMTEYRAVMDTVVLRPNERIVEMTWRARVPLPRPLARLRLIQVHEKVIR